MRVCLYLTKSQSIWSTSLIWQEMIWIHCSDMLLVVCTLRQRQIAIAVLLSCLLLNAAGTSTFSYMCRTVINDHIYVYTWVLHGSAAELSKPDIADCENQVNHISLPLCLFASLGKCGNWIFSGVLVCVPFAAVDLTLDLYFL